MSRWLQTRTLALAVATACLLAVVPLAGCEQEPEVTPGGSDTPATTDDSPSGAPVGGYDPMQVEGANEAAAFEALEVLYEAERDSDNWPEIDWAALDGVDPILIAYLVRVDYGDQVALFEVRADGLPHNLYAYQKAFDSGSIIWTPADQAMGAFVGAQSAGELTAAQAVDAAMRDAFPNESFTVTIHGYRFAYLLDGVPEFAIEVAPDGALVSAGTF